MSSSSTATARVPRAAVLWGTSVAILAVLFLWWPYQTGYFNMGRLSVLGGWWKWLSADTSGEWIFCPFVPLVSGFIAWSRRQELMKLRLVRHRGGMVLICLALFSFWVGYKADTAYPGFAAFQLMVAGLILWFCGWQWMRVLMFPLLFLVFMWPIVPLEYQVASPMRMITSHWASGVLSLLGVPNIREGTTILSAGNAMQGVQNGALFKLDVEDACSGIRSLYSLMMLSALYGYLFLRGWKPRLILFLSALPFAMLGNLVRMVMLGLASMWFGSEFAIGKQNSVGEMQISGFHELAGLVVFAVALAGIFALSSFLEGVPWKRQPKGSKSLTGNVEAPGEIRLGVWQSAGAALVPVIALLVICAYVSGQPTLSPPGVRMDLPASVGASPGQDIPITAIERGALLSDVSLSRKAYFTNDGKAMLASIVLSGESRRGLHRPDICLPSQGWVIADQQSVPVTFSDGREINAMMMRVFKDVRDPETGIVSRQRGINIYWYQGYNNVHTPSYYGHVARTYFDAVFKNLNHRWALVSFFTQMSDSQAGMYDTIAETAALEEVRSFISEIGPLMVK